MVEEIIAAPSCFRWLFVIARNSSFTHKSQAVDVRQVSRELGVRYVLEGSVRKGGNRVRIAAGTWDAFHDHVSGRFRYTAVKCFPLSPAPVEGSSSTRGPPSVLGVDMNRLPQSADAELQMR